MKVSQGFSRTQIVLHWATALLVIPIWILHDGMVNTSRALRHNEIPTPSDALIAQFHVWGGIAVLVLVIWRLYLRYTCGAPAAPESESAFLKFVASATHVLLYGLLLYLGTTGILAYFLSIDAARELHELAKLPILLLFILHSAAALYHHFILKTDVLKRMLKAR
jgi:cytochrome b561